MSKAIILFSGGLDSTTCLNIAQSAGHTCLALTINYGQKHQKECDYAVNAAKKLNIAHRLIDLPIGAWGGSALTDSNIAVKDHDSSQAIPNTYVPARNLIFLSLALSLAEAHDAKHIYLGVSAVDYSGYPDCRPEFITQFQQLANISTKAGVSGQPIQIHAPLLHLSKADTIKLGIKLGINYAETLSCYRATPDGLACRTCDACVLRATGFTDAKIPDPTHYA